MSETAPASQYEKETLAVEHEVLLPAHAGATHEKAAHETPAERIEKLAEARQAASHEAASINPIERVQAAEAVPEAPTRHDINQELRSITLQRELKHIRRKLPVTDRALSRIIHQPAVRIISEAAGKTVSRPSGLLGGGILAFIGTSAYFYLARHVGFQYNFGVFAALFVAGFLIGLVLEWLAYGATASRRNREN